MTEKMERMSFTVPPEFKANLSYVASRLGISKSAVVHQILGGALADVRQILADIPVLDSPFDTSSDSAKRFKHNSITYINEAAATLNRMFDESDKDARHDSDC